MIYNQTVQLVTFLPTFNALCMRLKIDVMKRERKNLEFWDNLDKAQDNFMYQQNKSRNLFLWTSSP